MIKKSGLDKGTEEKEGYGFEEVSTVRIKTVTGWSVVFTLCNYLQYRHQLLITFLKVPVRINHELLRNTEFVIKGLSKSKNVFKKVTIRLLRFQELQTHKHTHVLKLYPLDIL